MKHLVRCAVLVAVTLWAYSNSFPGAFHYDDFGLMLESDQVASPAFDYTLFLENYGGRPLTLWTFYLNHSRTGADPLFFHLVSLVLHLGVGLLLYGVSLRLFRLSTAQAFVIALVFLVHPLQTQAVNYIWARSVLLMSFFSLISLLLVRTRPASALFAFQLAMWSRIDALLLAPALVRVRPSIWRWAVPIVLANLGATVAGLYRHQPPNFGFSHPDPWAYWQQQPLALLRFWQLFVWPSGLSLVHDLSQTRWMFLMGAILSLSAALIMWLRSSGRAPAGLAFAAAGLFLLPSLLIPNADPFNESRLYLPVAAVTLGLVVSLPPPSRPGWGKWIGWAGVVLCLVVATRTRNVFWRDDVVLWKSASGSAPGSVLVHYNLGSALARAGNVESARGSFRRALRLNPFDDLSYSGLGYCAEVVGSQEEAMAHYRQALELNAENAYAWQALTRMGRGTEAPTGLGDRR